MNIYNCPCLWYESTDSKQPSVGLCSNHSAVASTAAEELKRYQIQITQQGSVSTASTRRTRGMGNLNEL